MVPMLRDGPDYRPRAGGAGLSPASRIMGPTMRYEGQVYRPPSEADSYILQATIGCSWNHCTYCDMYRSKPFRVRELGEILSDIRAARLAFGGDVEKIFVADGDALMMDLEHWEAILTACRAERRGLPHQPRVELPAALGPAPQGPGADRGGRRPGALRRRRVAAGMGAGAVRRIAGGFLSCVSRCRSPGR